MTAEQERRSRKAYPGGFSWATRAAGFLGALLIILCLPLFYYPRRYGDIVSEACARHEVEPALVYAVIFAESKFDPSAVSRRGAKGLMQLMPATAAWCAQKIGITYDETKLAEPAYNVNLGVYYLSYLLNRFSERDAIAAYNAGEGNVLSWRARNLKDIPFPETAAYVKKVDRAKWWYQR